MHVVKKVNGPFFFQMQVRDWDHKICSPHEIIKASIIWIEKRLKKQIWLFISSTIPTSQKKKTEKQMKATFFLAPRLSWPITRSRIFGMHIIIIIIIFWSINSCSLAIAHSSSKQKQNRGLSPISCPRPSCLFLHPQGSSSCKESSDSWSSLDF